MAPQHRVLDLGCGPGPLARGFAPLVRDVIAVDPSPEMLAEARVLAGQATNIRFVAGSSYDLDPALGVSASSSWVALSIGWIVSTR